MPVPYRRYLEMFDSWQITKMVELWEDNYLDITHYSLTSSGFALIANQLSFLDKHALVSGSQTKLFFGFFDLVWFSHSPLLRMSANTFRIKWHPTNVLQVGFQLAGSSSR